MSLPSLVQYQNVRTPVHNEPLLIGSTPQIQNTSSQQVFRGKKAVIFLDTRHWLVYYKAIFHYTPCWFPGPKKYNQKHVSFARYSSKGEQNKFFFYERSITRWATQWYCIIILTVSIWGIMLQGCFINIQSIISVVIRFCSWCWSQVN